MTFLAEQASTIFNKVMQAHSIDLRALPHDFAIGNECILPALNRRGEILSNKLFDLLFPRLNSSVYYHYIPFSSFQAVVEQESLRFFSTRKLSSEGEFIPLCRDLELDGYWRLGSGGMPEGEHASLMDDLFYKSFVASPEENAGELWEIFAENGTGARLSVRIDVNSEYPDFRQVSYQGASSIAALESLLKAFREKRRQFVPFGLSRMPGYYQLKKWSHHKECRLIAKRHLGAHDCFPFKVNRDESNLAKCNYIDCSLTNPTCSAFQLKLIGAVPGPNADDKRKADIANLWRKYQASEAGTT
jgi:hypothetical protein